MNEKRERKGRSDRLWEKEGEDMDEETAVANGVCSYGSPTYRVGTYVYDASCCKFRYIYSHKFSFLLLDAETTDQVGLQ